MQYGGMNAKKSQKISHCRGLGHPSSTKMIPETGLWEKDYKKRGINFFFSLLVTKTGENKNKEYCQKGESNQFKTMRCHS